MAVSMKKQNGLTLIEIMISLLLGLIVIGGALSIYIASIRGSTDVVNGARLNYDLDSIMQLMVNDIRRAGYWGGAITGSSVRNPAGAGCSAGNPFTCGTANIQLPTASCILYTYDADSNGTVDNGEYFGFKLEDGSIKISSADTVDATVDCTASDYRWQTITDENKINISNLTFSDANYKCLNTTTLASFDTPCASVSSADLPPDNNAVETREITITMVGNVKDEGAVNKTLSAIVKVRNNRIFTQ